MAVHVASMFRKPRCKEFVERAKSMGVVVDPNIEREATGAEPSE
jgi:hypothetical protein